MFLIINCYKKFLQLYTTTRLFWIIVIGISCWNMTVICILMLKRYISDSISISVETSFLHWNITFPSVSICLSKSRSNVEIMRFLNQKNINYIKNIHNYLFITPTNINTKEDYCRGFNSTCGVNIHIAREQVSGGSIFSCISAFVCRKWIILSYNVQNYYNYYKSLNYEGVS